jgi:GMP synthase (glutamine-hydrolysing)
VKPFLLLAIRAEDAAADNEYESFLAFAGLGERDLRRWRLEQRALGDVDLQDWSGILLGGGPFNYSDPEETKSPVQRRVEADLRALLERVISADFPFLGACYGIGTLGRHQGAVVDRRYAERSVPSRSRSLGKAGWTVLRGAPTTFDAFVGHKEAISVLPRHAILLASSPPARAGVRIGSHVYATQFHPELDVVTVHPDRRLQARGYFEPEQAGELKAQPAAATSPPVAILRRFAQRYAQRAGRGEPSAAACRRLPVPAAVSSPALTGRRGVPAAWVASQAEPMSDAGDPFDFIAARWTGAAEAPWPPSRPGRRSCRRRFRR